jgi:integrase
MTRIAKDDAARATHMARVVSDRIRGTGGVPTSSPETVNEYAQRWLLERTTRGLSTVNHDKGRLNGHVLDRIGTIAMTAITKDHIERVVEDLDRKILLDEGEDERIQWKTAANVWSTVTKLFADAVNSKRRDLRVLAVDPTDGVHGPERGERKAKQYLYPSEFTKLVSCDGPNGIDLKFRTLYAAAVYTFARAGELEALTWADVDLEHRVIRITKAIDRRTGKVKSTKSGETRRIPIEPALLPLLDRLYKARKLDDAPVLGFRTTRTAPSYCVSICSRRASRALSCT